MCTGYTQNEQGGLFNVAKYAPSVAGFHGSQSGLKCGDEVQEGAGVRLENLPSAGTDSVTNPTQEQTQRQHGNHLLTDCTTRQLPEEVRETREKYGRRRSSIKTSAQNTT